VPRPPARGSGAYPALPEAEAETQAIHDIFAPLSDDVDLSLLAGSDATFDGVFKATRAKPYHIVHFSGHAYLDKDNPNKSALVLFDSDFSTGQIFNFFCKRPPLFFFMNACDTAQTSSASSLFKDSYDIFDLARSFLETGAYLIGNRSKVGDQGAGAFAKAFYQAMIAGDSLGRAVRSARIACRKAGAADDFSWASYILYGDPRLCFRKL
jgi:CHAT domain-containing protein